MYVRMYVAQLTESLLEAHTVVIKGESSEVDSTREYV